MLGRSISAVCQIQVRAVSSKYTKPTPRHYKRRLFEAALQPEIPKTTKVCTPPGMIKREKIEKAKEYSDVEIALSNLVRSYIKKEEFRVMAVCQFLPVPGRTLWFAKNQLRLKGVEFRNYGNKIVKKVFENTPMTSLNVVLVGSNALLFSKDLNGIKTITQECEKLNWLQPLVFMADNRIIDVKEAQTLAKLASMDDLRAQTVQILGQQLGQITMSLDSATRHLPNLLDAYTSRKDQ
ncbi:unnamed protein product [Caenorhabditis bovis]|uniref:Large ribosomal subunit protein uL10m n=1 Tax=Caenorhabditis bovis TaxID=2654633 RepID=A0A8S1EWU4_9PELO|nr:unnamed protein product [Caenorhabditis bovis]